MRSSPLGESALKEAALSNIANPHDIVSIGCRWVAICLMSFLAFGCSDAVDSGDAGAGGIGGGGAGGNGGGLIDAKIFTVPLQVNSYDTSSDEPPIIYSSVTSMMFGTFPLDPLAVRYTVEHANTKFPLSDFTESWNAGDPLPASLLISDGIVGGYEAGIVGGEYFIWVTGEGCQSGVGGACQPGTESTLATESRLKEIRQTSTLTVTIEYE